MSEPGVVRAIAFIDSIHVGSRMAVFPEGFRFDGTRSFYELSENQQILLAGWNAFWDECRNVGVDTAVFVGEFIDGISRAEWGKYQITTDLNEQVRAAIQLVRPQVKGMKVRGVSGSLYHIAADTFDFDKQIIENLGGVHAGWIGHYKFAPSEKIFSVSHTMSYTISAHPATILSKEIQAVKIAESLGRLAKDVNKVDVIVKGHVHDWLLIHEKKVAAFSVPGWKMFYVIKGRTNYWPRRLPTIGGVIVRITEDDRLRIWPELYETPHDEGLLEEL